MPRAKQAPKELETSSSTVAESHSPSQPPATSSSSAAPTSPAGDKEQKKPYFELIVTSFDGILPGQDGYKEEKDRLLTGFNLGQSTIPHHLPKGTKIEEVTAYDFLTNPKTGLREGQTREPWGCGKHDLRSGVGQYVPLPPVEIWGRGAWLVDVIWDESFDYDELPYVLKQKIDNIIPTWPKKGQPEELFHFWLTSGEGTPANNLYQIYELPLEQAKLPKPKHPKMWPESLRKWRTGGTSSPTAYTGLVNPPVTTPYTAKPTIPAGVRMRCPDCGHWFKMDDLSGHNKVCGKGEDAEWAMMCDPACGCHTLDEAAKPKDGFPRPKKAQEPAENGAEAPVAATA